MHSSSTWSGTFLYLHSSGLGTSPVLRKWPRNHSIFFCGILNCLEILFTPCCFITISSRMVFRSSSLTRVDFRYLPGESFGIAYEFFSSSIKRWASEETLTVSIFLEENCCCCSWRVSRMYWSLFYKESWRTSGVCQNQSHEIEFGSYMLIFDEKGQSEGYWILSLSGRVLVFM